MTIKRAVSAVGLLLCICTLAGCWDAHELDTLSIIAGLGIDQSNTQGEYVFSVEIGKAQKSQISQNKDKQESAFLVLSCQSRTMLLAFEQFRLKNSRELFLHPNQIVIFGKDLAKKGLTPLIDMLLRNHESRLEVWTAVADGSAADILNTKTKQEPITAAVIDRLMQNATSISNRYTTTVYDMISHIEDKGTALIMPIIGKAEEPESTSLQISGSALFLHDKMVGELSADETLGYLFATGMHDGLLNVPMDDGTAVMQISYLFSNAKPVISNGSVSVELNVQALLAVGELLGFKNQSIVDLMPKIREAAQQAIIEKISATFKKAQSYKTDIYGFGTMIYRQYPQQWDAMKDNWDNIFSQLTLKLSVKAQLSNTGFVTDSIEMKGDKP